MHDLLDRSLRYLMELIVSWFSAPAFFIPYPAMSANLRPQSRCITGTMR